ncbi:hypothetical protein ABLE92_24500 [Gordonia sp. VNQ95]|uniref:hypothetical protein n=1 Tax=Gordonia sp. VNQ95 TaxID=3156619 RepID=UPI0032B58CCF
MNAVGETELVIRAGVRPTGAVLFGVNLVIGVVMTFAGITLMATASDPGFFVMSLVAAISGALLLVAVVVIGLAWWRGEALAVITDTSITLCAIDDPALREWAWSDIVRIDVDQEIANGVRIATVYRFTLIPGERTDALMTSMPTRTRWLFTRRPADPTCMRVTSFHTPAPRRIRKFLYSVAPRRDVIRVDGRPA